MPNLKYIDINKCSQSSRDLMLHSSAIQDLHLVSDEDTLYLYLLFLVKIVLPPFSRKMHCITIILVSAETTLYPHFPVKLQNTSGSLLNTLYPQFLMKIHHNYTSSFYRYIMLLYLPFLSG
mgnify:CR=1 FL=1